MEQDWIEDALELGEDSRTEFKSVARSDFTINPQHLAKEIAALANSGGGRLFLGVEDNGTPSGIGDASQADALMRLVSQVCQGTVHPAIVCRIQKARARGVPILVVEVPGFSPDRPYRAGNVYYVRDANLSRDASRDELVRLLESVSVHFDEEPVTDSTRGDLDTVALCDFLERVYGPAAVEQVDRYLLALKCLDPKQTPTVAGILFFARDPQRWLPDARVSAVRFPGTTVGSEFLDRKELEGRVPALQEAAMAFLAEHVRAPSSVQGLDRLETGLPVSVLREAVANAIAHRDYRKPSQIRIFVFDDRVEIQNPGGLLNHLTVDSIRLGGITQRRNPVIAALLSRLSRRENLGIGVVEIIQQMRARGLPEPEFDVQAGHFRVVLRTREPLS